MATTNIQSLFTQTVVRSFEKWQKLLSAEKITWSNRLLFWGTLSIGSPIAQYGELTPWQFASSRTALGYFLHWRETTNGWELFYSHGEQDIDLFNDRGWITR